MTVKVKNDYIKHKNISSLNYIYYNFFSNKDIIIVAKLPYSSPFVGGFCSLEYCSTSHDLRLASRSSKR